MNCKRTETINKRIVRDLPKKPKVLKRLLPMRKKRERPITEKIVKSLKRK